MLLLFQLLLLEGFLVVAVVAVPVVESLQLIRVPECMAVAPTHSGFDSLDLLLVLVSFS